MQKRLKTAIYIQIHKRRNSFESVSGGGAAAAAPGGAGRGWRLTWGGGAGDKHAGQLISHGGGESRTLGHRGGGRGVVVCPPDAMRH